VFKKSDGGTLPLSRWREKEQGGGEKKVDRIPGNGIDSKGLIINQSKEKVPTMRLKKGKLRGEKELPFQKTVNGTSEVIPPGPNTGVKGGVMEHEITCDRPKIQNKDARKEKTCQKTSEPRPQ